MLVGLFGSQRVRSFYWAWGNEALILSSHYGKDAWERFPVALAWE